MSDHLAADNAGTDAAPRRAAVLLTAVVLGAIVAGTTMLWVHYGTAVFFETIRTGLAACFG